MARGGAMGQGLAGLIGGAIFCLLLLVLGLGLWLSLGGAVLGYVAGLLILGRGRDVELTVGGASRELAEAAVREAEAKLRELRALAREPTRSRDKIEAIASVVAEILEDLRRDPKDIQRARSFLSYYLDAALRIIRRYVELAGKDSDEVRAAVGRVESHLDLIHRAFRKQLSLLLEDDVMDLDSELALLERTVRMEGLGETKK